MLLVQVVAFQATLELMAQQFPGAFAGYKLEVTESHQRQKADTSGTAKAVVASIAKLGAPISEVKASGDHCHTSGPVMNMIHSVLFIGQAFCAERYRSTAMHKKMFGVC